MRVLALEVEQEGAKAGDFQPFLMAEAQGVWQLMQEDVIREIYFRADRKTAVLLLECPDIAAAQQTLNTLPLVAAGLITFELIPLTPYSGFSRLFKR